LDEAFGTAEATQNGHEIWNLEYYQEYLSTDDVHWKQWQENYLDIT
jgi:hypothetical protein